MGKFDKLGVPSDTVATKADSRHQRAVTV
jgi:hypothetical protein